MSVGHATNGNGTFEERAAAEAMLRALEIPCDPATVQGQEFLRHAETMCKAMSLLWAKRGYGQSWRQHGYLGSVLKISMKTNRLMNLLWWKHPKDVPTELADEDAGDTFMDLINYGVFGYEQWRAGEERGPREEVG